MKKKEIVFHIKAEEYKQIRQYRQEMDLHVIRDQIERNGRAFIVRLRDDRSLQKISEMPAPGEATPWYGMVGGGYRYTARPLASGCSLKVENTASVSGFFSSKILPSLEINLVEDALVAETETRSTGLPALDYGLQFAEDPEDHEIILKITPDLFELLERWNSWGEPLDEYEFCFSPLSIGTMVRVKNTRTGDEIDLTKDTRW